MMGHLMVERVSAGRVTAGRPRASECSGAVVSRCRTALQFMQKKNSLYALLKEDSVWSMERLNRHINDTFGKTKGLPRDWVFTTFTVRVLFPNPGLWGGG